MARAQEVLRECAHSAGLIEEIDSPRLLLAREAEAAALRWAALTADGVLRPGQTVLVVDCGGGTVDILLLRVSDIRGHGAGRRVYFQEVVAPSPAPGLL